MRVLLGDEKMNSRKNTVDSKLKYRHSKCYAAQNLILPSNP